MVESEAKRQMESDANLGVQLLQLREVAELWWDGASELI